jgi:hypothetical protein
VETYEVSIGFRVHADNEEHAVEQFIELLHDNGDTPNRIIKLDS